MQEMCLAVPTARLVPTIIEIYDHDYPGHALRRRHRVNVRRRVIGLDAELQTQAQGHSTRLESKYQTKRLTADLC